MSKLIYKKNYPYNETDNVIKDYFRNIKLSGSESEEIVCSYAAIDELLKMVNYIESPKKLDGARRFIRKSIRIAMTYKLDIEIKTMDNFISAKFGLGAGGNVRWIKKMMKFVDDIQIFADKEYDEAYLILEYYTNSIYINNKKFMPPNKNS